MTKQILTDFIAQSQTTGPLHYNNSLACRLAAEKETLSGLVETYLAAQPCHYQEDMRALERLNCGDAPLAPTAEIFVFVPCFNEEKNLKNLLEQFDAQVDERGRPLSPERVEICFVINCPDSLRNRNRLEQAVSILLAEKEHRSNLHILPKVFTPSEACLGRARKYGIDYALARARRLSPEKSARACLVCCEGDTIRVPKDYLIRYARHFQDGKPKLVQGVIAYPSELTTQFESLRALTTCREALVYGQGSRPEEFRLFHGLMPVGRNMAISPEVCVRTGGIDPIRRADTDDDINFGFDIVRFLGESTKRFSDVEVVTSPRREILIIKEIFHGPGSSLKDSYEKFHDNSAVYDFTYDRICALAEEYAPRQLTREQLCLLLAQTYQWVMSSRLKEAFAHLPDVAPILARYATHEIGYWEKEGELWNLFSSQLQREGSAKPLPAEDAVADDALHWFNIFNRELGTTFRRTNNGIFSALI